LGIEVSDYQVQKVYLIKPNIANNPRVARVGKTIGESVYFVLDPKKSRLFSFNDNSKKEGKGSITEDDLKETHFVKPMYNIDSIQRVGNSILAVGVKDDGKTTLILVNRSGEVTSETEMGADFGTIKKVVVDAQNPDKFTLLSFRGYVSIQTLMVRGDVEIINKSKAPDLQSTRVDYLTKTTKMLDVAMSGDKFLGLWESKSDHHKLITAVTTKGIQQTDMKEDVVGVTYLESHPYSLHDILPALKSGVSLQRRMTYQPFNSSPQ